MITIWGGGSSKLRDNDHRLRKVQPNGTSKDMNEFNLQFCNENQAQHHSL